MDGLNETERALAWAASWHPSLVGTAIINENLTFRSVNPEFCDILGVTPAELIGNSFADITPQPVKALDLKNAELVKKGVIESYLLHKSYEFGSGRRVDFVLLVNGVYSKDGDFQFYVSRIILPPAPTSQSLSKRGLMRKLLENWQPIAAILAAMSVIIAGVINEIKTQ